MIRAIFVLLSFVSIVIFPWPLTVAFALITSFFIPLMPLAVGIVADAFYYGPSGSLPLFTIYGVLATVIAFFVRHRLRASMIRG